MKGKVLVIGGAEDKDGNSDPFSNQSILERFVSETRIKNGPALKSLLALRPFPKKWGKNILKHYIK